MAKKNSGSRNSVPFCTNANVMSMKQFAEANSNPADWERDGDEVVVYFSDQLRMRISFDKNTSLEYFGKLIGYRDDYPVDHSEVFAGDLVVAIRDQLSALDIQMLLLRLAKELSDWQFEPGFKKRVDICSEVAQEIGKINGFENIAMQPAQDEDAKFERFVREIESLRHYEEMVLDACGELETFDEYRAFLRALIGQREELSKDAARYKKLRRLNVPQLQALFKRNINGEGPFDQMVDELR